MRHGEGEAYSLVAWVIMPNHVHVVVQMGDGSSLAEAVRLWKGRSARAINRDLGRRGALWQREYHDRFIRDQDHLAAAVAYVHSNPVTAGLCATPEDWPLSSARYWRLQSDGGALRDASGPDTSKAPCAD